MPDAVRIVFSRQKYSPQSPVHVTVSPLLKCCWPHSNATAKMELTAQMRMHALSPPQLFGATAVAAKGRERWRASAAVRARRHEAATPEPTNRSVKRRMNGGSLPAHLPWIAGTDGGGSIVPASRR